MNEKRPHPQRKFRSPYSDKMQLHQHSRATKIKFDHQSDQLMNEQETDYVETVNSELQLERLQEKPSWEVSHAQTLAISPNFDVVGNYNTLKDLKMNAAEFRRQLKQTRFNTIMNNAINQIKNPHADDAFAHVRPDGNAGSSKHRMNKHTNGKSSSNFSHFDNFEKWDRFQSYKQKFMTVRADKKQASKSVRHFTPHSQLGRQQVSLKPNVQRPRSSNYAFKKSMLSEQKDQASSKLNKDSSVSTTSKPHPKYQEHLYKNYFPQHQRGQRNVTLELNMVKRQMPNIDLQFKSPTTLLQNRKVSKSMLANQQGPPRMNSHYNTASVVNTANCADNSTSIPQALGSKSLYVEQPGNVRASAQYQTIIPKKGGSVLHKHDLSEKSMKKVKTLQVSKVTLRQSLDLQEEREFRQHFDKVHGVRLLQRQYDGNRDLIAKKEQQLADLRKQLALAKYQQRADLDLNVFERMHDYVETGSDLALVQSEKAIKTVDPDHIRNLLRAEVEARMLKGRRKMHSVTSSSDVLPRSNITPASSARGYSGRSETRLSKSVHCIDQDIRKLIKKRNHMQKQLEQVEKKQQEEAYTVEKNKHRQKQEIKEILSLKVKIEEKIPEHRCYNLISKDFTSVNMILKAQAHSGLMKIQQKKKDEQNKL